jgi:hypothetical protein
MNNQQHRTNMQSTPIEPVHASRQYQIPDLMCYVSDVCQVALQSRCLGFLTCMSAQIIPQHDMRVTPLVQPFVELQASAERLHSSLNGYISLLTPELANSQLPDCISNIASSLDPVTDVLHLQPTVAHCLAIHNTFTSQNTLIDTQHVVQTSALRSGQGHGHPRCRPSRHHHTLRAILALRQDKGRRTRHHRYAQPNSRGTRLLTLSTVRLQSGALAVFSPVALTDDVKAKVASLGEVKYITALDAEVSHHPSHPPPALTPPPAPHLSRPLARRLPHRASPRS